MTETNWKQYILDNKFLFFILFLWGINFGNLGGLMLLILVFYYIVFRQKSIKMDAFNTMIFLLGLSILPFSLIHDELTNLNIGIKIIALSFVVNFIEIKPGEIYKVKTIIVFIAVAFSVQLGLHYTYNMINGIDIVRGLHNVWTGKLSAATGLGALLTPIAGIIIPLIITQRLKSAVPLIILFFLSIIINLYLAGRSYFGLILVSIISIVIVVIKQRPSKKIWQRFIAIIIILLSIYIINYDKIMLVYETSNFYERFFSDSSQEMLSDTPRSELWFIYIKEMPNYLLGGYNILQKASYYSHTLWLDIYDAFGIFAFIFSIIITILAIKTVYRLFKSRFIAFSDKIFIISTFCVLFAQFCLEPVIQGCLFVFEYFCIFISIVLKLRTKPYNSLRSKYFLRKLI